MTSVESSEVGSGQVFDPRADALDAMARLVEHHRHRTTDQAETTYRIPVDRYRDHERWALEREKIFRRVPLALALSCEVPQPGDYKALEVTGVPLLVVRGDDGLVRARLNICRHRGAPVAAEGRGSARRFTCGYHGWSYDREGALAGVYGESTFGEVDRCTHGLVPLPCEERAGLVFVVLDPEGTMDLDAWLGDYLPRLEALGLDAWHLHDARWLDGPNWKVAYDGYLESYHFAQLHRDSVFKTNFGNMATVERFGPHQRYCLGLRPLAEAADRPREEWDPPSCVGAIYTIFPNISIAGGWRDVAAVSISMPGTTPTTSRTQQLFVTRHLVEGEAREKADETADWFFQVVRDEDYAATFSVQRNVDSGLVDEFVFGRNEPCLHHFHDWVDRLVEG